MVEVLPNPSVSAIIIVYNGERYLAEAIESVIAQSFTDWELIIADDGSRDRCIEIAQDYAGRYPDRIRAISHSDRANHGMSATRNLGISAARAPLIGFLDCDDIWHPEKLAEQVAILKQQPDAEMVYGRTLIWHSWQSGEPGDDYYYDLGVPPDCLVQPPKLLAVLLENKCQTPTTCNALLRAGLIRRIGGFDDRFRGMFEDQVFFAKALLTASTYVSSRSWAQYRQHGESFSAQSAARGQDNRMRLIFLGWLASYVLRTMPTNLAILAQIARLAAGEIWIMFRPRRPRWMRVN